MRWSGSRHRSSRRRSSCRHADGRASRSRRRGESMNSHPMRIGVLALQGDFALHARALEQCGCTAVQVRKPAELEDVAGLIIPGGESTTLLKLTDAWGFAPPIQKFHRELTDNTTVHRYFCDLVGRGRVAA